MKIKFKQIIRLIFRTIAQGLNCHLMASIHHYNHHTPWHHTKSWCAHNPTPWSHSNHNNILITQYDLPVCLVIIYTYNLSITGRSVHNCIHILSINLPSLVAHLTCDNSIEWLRYIRHHHHHHHHHGGRSSVVSQNSNPIDWLINWLL